MRNVILFAHISLDGFAAGPNGELDWIPYDEELEKYAEKLVKETGTALYGRVTYEMMTYWRTVPSNPDATKHELEHAHWIEEVEKVVFSRSMKSSDWNNTKIIGSNIKEEVLRLKEQPGKNLMIFGSPGLAQTLMELDLIDEYRLTLNPVILGSGKPLFHDSKEKAPLKLLEAKTLNSGVICLHYQVVR
jgi:dihydrofolate reductase